MARSVPTSRRFLLVFRCDDVGGDEPLHIYVELPRHAGLFAQQVQQPLVVAELFDGDVYGFGMKGAFIGEDEAHGNGCGIYSHDFSRNFEVRVA